MIQIICGGIGSGKTISAVRMIAQREFKAYTNFNTVNLESHRIKWKDIINKIAATTNKNGEVTKYDYTVNFKFWENAMNKEPADIYIDELQEFASSRRSISKANQTAS